MGERPNIAGGHGQHGVKQARQRDPLRLRDHLEVGGVGIERAAAGLGDGEDVLVLAEHDLLTECAVVGLVSQLQRVGAVPLGEDHRDYLGRDQPVDAQARLQLFQQHCLSSPSIAGPR